MIPVLLIDDDPAFGSELQPRFAAAGLKLDCATSVSTAKKLIDRNRYSGLLLDLVLREGENGLDILRYLQEKGLVIPTIIVSEYLPDYTRDMAAFFTTVKLAVAKPISAETLASLASSVTHGPASH